MGRATGRVAKLVGVLTAAGRNLLDHEGFEFAGHLAFSALLALFPFLIFLTAIAGMLASGAGGDRFIRFLFEFTPPEVAQTLLPVIDQVLATLLVMLWTASSGIEALRLVLNRAYGDREGRPWWRRRLQGFAFVILGSVAMVGLSFALVIGPAFWTFVEVTAGIAPADRTNWAPLRYPIAAAAMVAVALALHRWLPSRRLAWRVLLPGVVTSLLAAMLAGHLFSAYLGSFASYNVTYGSLGGVVVTLLFLYLNAVIFIFGAELNAELASRRSLPAREERAAGAVQPLGGR
jgi:membrane protein